MLYHLAYRPDHQTRVEPVLPPQPSATARTSGSRLRPRAPLSLSSMKAFQFVRLPTGLAALPDQATISPALRARSSLPPRLDSDKPSRHALLSFPSPAASVAGPLSDATRAVETPRRLDLSIPKEASLVAPSFPSSRRVAARAPVDAAGQSKPVPSKACASSVQAKHAAAKECFFGSVAVGLACSVMNSNSGNRIKFQPKWRKVAYGERQPGYEDNYTDESFDSVSILQYLCIVALVVSTWTLTLNLGY
ncbi:hypothetical protein PR202_gb09104 [Eleusine coracana subsp. coracana]|uniref:Uncharacterized protein n=1 Tax=Eleusine coracana subsp. coracana TaxID=191504 RepID=A0AAV5EGF0_ELECO|nr:hypothetical protein PR202_gb09104 [Eleusine coracana subsp. coracana]